MGQKWLEQVIRIQQEEEEAEHSYEEDEGGGIAETLYKLTIDMAGTEEEAEEGLEAVLEMEVVEDGGSKFE